MAIRLSGAKRSFRHDGLFLEAGWSSFESLSDKQRATLRDFHGRHVRVHPDDYGELAKLGLTHQKDDDGHLQLQAPLVELDPPKTPKTAKADKAVDKKEG